jgi:hypothetical protein
MSELQKKKQNILSQLRSLCAHCACSPGREHCCPVKELSLRIEALKGVPLVVNSEFRGVLWTH